jgi:hypothetical protein
MKEIIVMNNVKPKSVIINGDTHYKLKMHCKGKSMKIGGVVEDLIDLYLTNPREMQKLIDNNKSK